MKSFKELRPLNEGMIANADPPPVLVLRRTGIRVFAAGQRVANYKNDNLNIDVAIPYNPATLGKDRIGTVAEETEHKPEPIYETALHHIHAITKHKNAGAVKFANGSSHKVNAQTASMIIKLHQMMKPENKRKIENLLNQSADGLKKVADFAKLNMK